MRDMNWLLNFGCQEQNGRKSQILGVTIGAVREVFNLTFPSYPNDPRTCIASELLVSGGPPMVHIYTRVAAANMPIP